jgi:hypothetical protein
MFRHGAAYLENTVGAGAFGVNNPFGNPFPVKTGVVGEGHIVYPAAGPAMQVMVGIQPPVVADQGGIAGHLKDFPFLLQDRKITVYCPQANSFRLRDCVKNITGGRMILPVNRRQNQFFLAGSAPL